MKRGVIGALGLALAVAVLTTIVTTFGAASAQEREQDQERVVQAFSVLGGGSHLGVRIEDVNAELAEELGLGAEYGVHVASVVEGGPAEEAGLEDGDVILGWNGERVESAAQLQRLVRETPSGRTVQLDLFRGGSERQVSVTLGDSSSQFENLRITTAPRLAQELRDRIRTAVPSGVRVIGPGDVRIARPGGAQGVRIASFFGERGRLGVSVQNLGEQLAEYFEVDGGALVVSVVEDSPAEAAGIQAGDVITAIADAEVADPGDLIEALSEREAGPVTVRLVREGQERSITVELEEAPEWSHEEGDHEEADHEGGLAYGIWSGQDAPFTWHMEPFEMPAFQVGPIHFEGFEMEPFEWHFDLDDLDDLEGVEPGEIDISIPAIEIPGFEMPAIDLPAIEVPGFEIVAPRITITTGA